MAIFVVAKCSTPPLWHLIGVSHLLALEKYFALHKFETCATILIIHAKTPQTPHLY